MKANRQPSHDAPQTAPEPMTPDDGWFCGSPKKEARGGGICELRAGFGTDHAGAGRCKYHGGMTPGGRAAGLDQLAKVRFRQWREENPSATSGDPLTAILEVLAEVRDWHRFTRALVDDIAAGDWESRGKDGATQLTVFVPLLERAQERAYKVAADIVRLGIEERLTRVTEMQGQAIASVILGTLADLNLGERSEEATACIDRRLALVTGGRKEA